NMLQAHTRCMVIFSRTVCSQKLARDGWETKPSDISHHIWPADILQSTSALLLMIGDHVGGDGKDVPTTHRHRHRHPSAGRDYLIGPFTVLLPLWPRPVGRGLPTIVTVT